MFDVFEKSSNRCRIQAYIINIFGPQIISVNRHFYSVIFTLLPDQLENSRCIFAAISFRPCSLEISPRTSSPMLPRSSARRLSCSWRRACRGGKPLISASAQMLLLLVASWLCLGRAANIPCNGSGVMPCVIQLGGIFNEDCIGAFLGNHGHGWRRYVASSTAMVKIVNALNGGKGFGIRAGNADATHFFQMNFSYATYKTGQYDSTGAQLAASLFPRSPHLCLCLCHIPKPAPLFPNPPTSTDPCSVLVSPFPFLLPRFLLVLTTT